MVEASSEIEKEIADERPPGCWRLSIYDEAKTYDCCGMVGFANYSRRIARYVICLFLSKGAQMLLKTAQNLLTKMDAYVR